MSEFETIVNMYSSGRSVLQICDSLYGNPRIGLTKVYSTLKASGVYSKYKNTSYRRLYALDESYLDSIDDQYKAYILGFIAADGYIDESRGRIVISLHRKDRDILEKIRQCFRSTSPIRDHSRDGYLKSTLSLCSRRLVVSICKSGLRQGKSLTMPGTPYECVPLHLKHHFLRGYFDGDGCMTLGKKYVSGTKYQIQVIGTLEFLTKSFCEFFPTTCKIYKYKTCNMFCYKLSNKSKVLEFLGAIYSDSDIHLDRKFECYRAHVKPGELLETALEGNQQLEHSSSSESIERQGLQ